MKLVTYLALVATCELTDAAYVNLRALQEAAASQEAQDDGTVKEHETAIKKINKEVEQAKTKMQKVVDDDEKPDDEGDKNEEDDEDGQEDEKDANKK